MVMATILFECSIEPYEIRAASYCTEGKQKNY